MKFTEILEELKKGEKVTREEWEKVKIYRYKYIKLEYGDCVAYLKDGAVRHKGEELKTCVGCVFSCADFTAEDWKIYQENPTQMWKPQADETYYSIDKSGIIIGTNNAEFDMDRRAIELGNCFKTKEKALHMVEKIKIINKLRELSNIKFNETDDRHYMIVYDKDDGEIISDYCYSLNPIPFNVFFKTREDCQKAIDTIGEDNLKKYYFDIAEVEEEK